MYLHLALFGSWCRNVLCLFLRVIPIFYCAGICIHFPPSCLNMHCVLPIKIPNFYMSGFLRFCFRHTLLLAFMLKCILLVFLLFLSKPSPSSSTAQKFTNNGFLKNTAIIISRCFMTKLKFFFVNMKPSEWKQMVEADIIKIKSVSWPWFTCGYNLHPITETAMWLMWCPHKHCNYDAQITYCAAVASTT